MLLDFEFENCCILIITEDVDNTEYEHDYGIKGTSKGC